MYPNTDSIAAARGARAWHQIKLYDTVHMQRGRLRIVIVSRGAARAPLSSTWDTLYSNTCAASRALYHLASCVKNTKPFTQIPVRGSTREQRKPIKNITSIYQAIERTFAQISPQQPPICGFASIAATSFVIAVSRGTVPTSTSCGGAGIKSNQVQRIA